MAPALVLTQLLVALLTALLILELTDEDTVLDIISDIGVPLLPIYILSAYIPAHLLFLVPK